jgi:peptidyl-prolyl cis-trans isomerase C
MGVHARVAGWFGRVWPTVRREPLVHFLALGAALFAFSMWRGEPVDPASRTIRIDEATVRGLAESFAQTWNRPPTAAEIDGLIRDHVKEEVYYREALRLGLEADDPIIRRRLRSKMEYLAASQAESAVPGDAVLQAWLDRNAARYAIGARVSFDQIYLANAAASPPRLLALRARLGRTADWRTLGDPISLPRSMENAGQEEIARTFGDGFGTAVIAASPGAWTGPVASGFGAHLVRVRSSQPGRAPTLAEVRQRVENDWRAATVKQREAQAYQALLDAYDISIARP